MIYLILALVIFLGYGVACSIYEKQIIKSWSETYFSVKDWAFVIVLFSTGILTFIGYQSLCILISVMLLGVTASAPFFRDGKQKESTEIEKALHYGGATGSMIWGFAEIIYVLGLTGIILTSITGLIIFGLGRTKLRYKLALIEAVGFTVIIINLMIITNL